MVHRDAISDPRTEIICDSNNILSAGSIGKMVRRTGLPVSSLVEIQALFAGMSPHFLACTSHEVVSGLQGVIVAVVLQPVMWEDKRRLSEIMVPQEGV